MADAGFSMPSSQVLPNVRPGAGCQPFPLPARAGPLDPGRLKIIVTGTPKAGNTWIRHLLAELYELPPVALNPDFRANDWAALGPRWIGQQHYYPEKKVLEWAQAGDVVFIAPTRHPGDVLVSLRHHVQNMGGAAATDPLLPESMLRDPLNVYGEHTRLFVRTGFYLSLHLSIDWLRGGWAYPVRYEDLWRQPVETLRTLTGHFLPMPERRLRHAVCACEINLMQGTRDPERKFVRKGGIGSWMAGLPAGIKDALGGTEPYRAQLGALGYSMNLQDPANVRSAEPAAVEHPFHHRDTFANGVPLAPVLLRAYFDLPEELSARWPDGTSIAEDSFHSWLSRPAAADPHAGRAPMVTELAYYLRSLRPDVAEAYPDPFGADRVAFNRWFIFNAAGEYKFDRSFTFPVLRTWAEGSAL